MLGHPLIDDLVDRDTGALSPVVVVTDNGPCYKVGAFARYIRSRPESNTSAPGIAARRPTV